MRLHLGDGLRIVRQSYEPGLRLRAHAHAVPSMSIVIRGTLYESRARDTELALPLNVSFMGADLPHNDEFGPNGAELFQIHFESSSDIFDENRALFAEWTWQRAGPSVRPFLRLLRAVHNAETADVEQLIIDVLAAATSRPMPRGAPPRWLTRVRQAIDDATEWPRVAALARDAGVHRVHLAREFRRYCGCSVSAYLRRRRTQFAAARLMARGATIAGAAHDAGFHDHSHLCRAFASETGLSPSAYRRVVNAVSRGEALIPDPRAWRAVQARSSRRAPRPPEDPRPSR